MMERRRSKRCSRSAARFVQKFTFALALSLVWSACSSASKETATASSEVPHPSRNVSSLDPRAELSSSEAADGSVLLVTLKLGESKRALSSAASGAQTKGGELVTAVFEQTSLPFFKVDEDTYQAVFGVPFNHKPGPAAIKVKFDGKELELPFTIVDGNYRSEVLRVDGRHVNPRKKDLVRIKKEVAEVRAVYDRITPIKYWKGPFLFPVNSLVTSPFGTKRVYNGELQSFHQGLDLRAPTGTPIRSSAAGEVALAKNLFFTGNTVLVDHGYGVFTLYAHLSKLRVKKGQKVAPNQLLGLAGATGRASGPHLHWGAIIHRAKVNPLELTKVMQ